MIVVTTPMCKQIVEWAGLKKFKVNKFPDEEEGDFAILLSESKVKMDSLAIKTNTFRQIKESIKTVSKALFEKNLIEKAIGDEEIEAIFNDYKDDALYALLDENEFNEIRKSNKDKKVKVYSEFLKDIVLDIGADVIDFTYDKNGNYKDKANDLGMDFDYLVYPDYLEEEVLKRENLKSNEFKVIKILSHNNISKDPILKALPIAGYTANPYVGCPHACKYCYADFMKRFTGHKEEWGTFIDVKYWKPIKNPQKYSGETVIVGSVTDGYNQCEEEFCRTRQLLEELKGTDINLIITTKSDLVCRDLDLIKTFNDPLVSWSINTLDEDFKEDMDDAPSIKDRIKAMKRFHKEGIRTTCFISPIFPEITDPIEIIEEISDFCDYIWLENLNLRGGYKKTIFDYIDLKYPELVPLYKEIYTYKDMSYWKELDDEISAYARENDFMYIIDEEPFIKSPNENPIIINYFYHEKIRQSSKKKR